MEYTDFFQLTDKPFENTRNSRFFFESRSHAEALERMFYLVKDGNMHFGLLTGEIGSGKTITRTVLERRLASGNFLFVSTEYSNLPFEHLLVEIVGQIQKKQDPALRQEKYFLLTRLKELIAARVTGVGKHLVIILDEAQEMSREAMVELKNLTNMGEEERNFLTVILVGQPELRSRVKELPQLDQRISLRYHLNPLAPEDVGAYLEHRLRCAGHRDGRIFTTPAVALLARETKGVPREINRICKLALDRAFVSQRAVIDEGIVGNIVKDIKRQDGLL